MPNRVASVFSFPDTVNQVAARLVAAGVVAMATAALASGVPWLLIPLVYGFWARVLAGPSLSPLAQVVTRVLVPRLHLPERPTPGPPKRFAQAIGAALSTAALLTWVAAGWSVARWVLVPLDGAAFVEAAFGLCLGCQMFALLMRVGVIPERICQECADIVRRQRVGAARA